MSGKLTTRIFLKDCRNLQWAPIVVAPEEVSVDLEVLVKRQEETILCLLDSQKVLAEEMAKVIRFGMQLQAEIEALHQMIMVLGREVGLEPKGMRQ